jgi:hypothetical protein
MVTREQTSETWLAETADTDAVRTRFADFRTAMVLAFVLCGLLTITSLLVPPSLSHDAGWGMREWQTLKAGGPLNHIITPDPADISRDQSNFVSWWSPGQYLIPGVLTLLGLQLGSALSITSGVSLLVCLLGWIYVARYFAFSPRMTMLLVVLIATFRYSTLPFGIYNGGEILLQALTPWLILTGCVVPSTSALRAAGLACLAVLLAFFAKLTGIMVIGAALFAGAVESVIRLRRITVGVIAAAAGAIVAVGLLYVVWFSHGTTPASGTGWSFRVSDVLFAWGAPWGAGISWTDMMTSLLFNPRHPALPGGPEKGDLSLILLLLLLPVLLFITVIVKSCPECIRDANLKKLLTITVCFYAVSAFAMSAIFLHGGDVSVEERHLRAAGMLILVGVFALTCRLPLKSVSRLAVSAIFVFMSLYGITAFAYRARSKERVEIDGYSRVLESNVDASVLESLRRAFAQEGRDALFVLPSADAASAFPPSARILVPQIESDPQALAWAREYHGKVRGHLYVVVPTRLAQSPNTTLLLKDFLDYPFNAWESRVVGSSTVYVQNGTGTLN